MHEGKQMMRRVYHVSSVLFSTLGRCRLSSRCPPLGAALVREAAVRKTFLAPKRTICTSTHEKTPSLLGHRHPATKSEVQKQTSGSSCSGLPDNRPEQKCVRIGLDARRLSSSTQVAQSSHRLRRRRKIYSSEQRIKDAIEGFSAHSRAHRASLLDIDAFIGVEEEPASAGTEHVSSKERGVTSSNKRLASPLLQSFLRRMKGVIETCSVRLSEWAGQPSNRMIKNLELAMHNASFDAYAMLYEATRRRIEEPMIGGYEARFSFLLFHMRVCANYGAFSLMSLETRRAAHLLEDAIATARKAFSMKRPEKRRIGKRLGGRAEDPLSCTGKQCSDAVKVDLGSTTVLYLRVLLANAFSCEKLFWLAAQQYQLVLHTIDLYPSTKLVQIVPGARKYCALSVDFVREDAELFFRDQGRMHQALAQGRAQLLHQKSQGASTEAQMFTELTLARLYRESGQFAESQMFYEIYLDKLIKVGGQDHEGVMAELGRMLSFEANKVDAGLIYLKAAAELLSADVNDTLRVHLDHAPGLSEDGESTFVHQSSTAPVEEVFSTASRSGRDVTLRAASLLLDVALAHEKANDASKAIHFYKASVAMLRRGAFHSSSAWVLMRYADFLASLLFVDKALEHYIEAMELLLLRSPSIPRAASVNSLEYDRNGEYTPTSSPLPLQLSKCQRMVELHVGEVEAHLAFCLQSYVGDYRRAAKHYKHALQVIPKLEQIKEMGLASRTPSVSTRRCPQQVTKQNASLLAQTCVSGETLHWMMSNYVACCERLGEWKNAVHAQNQLIELEWISAVDMCASYLKLIELVDKLGDVEKKLHLCFLLFFFLKDDASAELLLQVAANFAECCYLVGNVSMGSILLHAVQEVKASNDPSVLIAYALNLKSLNEHERRRLESIADVKGDVHTILKVFRRAAQLIVTHRVVDEDDRMRPPSNEAAAHALQGKSYQENSELMSLIALSRGAFFFHQHGFTAEAEELYSTALSYTGDARATSSKEYQKELSILLANYAGLKAAEDPIEAERLYTQAANADPICNEVAGVVADFFLMTNNYLKGKAHIKRFIGLGSGNTAEMHLRLARLGTGPVWDRLSYGERCELLQHLLEGLGVASNRLALHRAPEGDLTEKIFHTRLSAFESLLVEGVSRTTNGEAACLACYIIQTKLDRPVLLNKMYKEAIHRFPTQKALLVNYADFCSKQGYHYLCRKYYALAFALSDGDSCRTRCYGNYYYSSDSLLHQRVVGEAIYRFYLDRYPNVSESNMMYAGYLASVMPTPFKTQHYFSKGLELDPNSKMLSAYAFYIWACADNPAVYTDESIQTQIFDKAEMIFQKAAQLEPDNPEVLQNLGRFYASRKGRTKEAIQALHKAHQLSPYNAEIALQLALVIEDECVRLADEERSRLGSAVKHRDQEAWQSSRLRALKDAVKQAFEKAIGLNPSHIGALDRYAKFAVTILKDHRLAATIWSRIQRLNRSGN